MLPLLPRNHQDHPTTSTTILLADGGGGRGGGSGRRRPEDDDDTPLGHGGGGGCGGGGGGDGSGGGGGGGGGDDDLGCSDAKELCKLLTPDRIVPAKRPYTGAFRQWWISMLEQVSQAHVDSDCAYRQARQCQLRSLPDDEIDNPSASFEALDAKWSAPFNLVVQGTVAANIEVAQQRADAEGKRITGRRKAAIVWYNFKISAAHGALYSSQNLTAVAIKIIILEESNTKWRTVCQGVNELVSEEIRRDLLFKQLKDEPAMKFDSELYQRAGAEGKTSGFPSFSLAYLESSMVTVIKR